MFFIAIGIAKYANLLDFSCCAEPLKHTAGLHQLLHLIRIWGNGRFLVAPFYLHEPVFKIDREHLTFLNAIRITCDNGESNVNAIAIKNSGERLCDHRRNPRQFDVIVTSNIFGDILSDEASQITGSIGMLPSASLAQGNFGMYEPVHGSAPDIAGQDKANPMATILSAAMMLRYTFGLGQEADAIENAVKSVLDQGYRTPDLFAGEGTLVGTAEMGRRIAEAI